MKISKTQLKRIIKEEIEGLSVSEDANRDISQHQRKISSRSDKVVDAVAQFEGAPEAIINYLKVSDLLRQARLKGEDPTVATPEQINLDDALHDLGDQEHAIFKAFREVHGDKIKTEVNQ